MTSLLLRDVAVGYGSTTVLSDVDLEVAAGATCAVLGPSGCGKTTLLRAIAGFVAPTSGTIALGDRTLVGPGSWTPPEERGIGLVPQEGALFPHLDVAGNVGFGLPRGARRHSARIEEVLDLVGLGGLARRAVHELSGGQQQRVALARALAPGPALVLLDEPFNALDASLRDSLRAEVRAALDAAGATAVLVTHDQDEALSFADTVAVLLGGRLAMQGTPEQVYAVPADLEVARFVGQVVVWSGEAHRGRAVTPLGAIPVRTPSGAKAQGRGRVMVRPEQVTVRSADTRARDGSEREPVAGDAVIAHVVEATYFGHDWLATLRLPSGEALQARGHGPIAHGSVEVGITGEGVFYPESP